MGICLFQSQVQHYKLRQSQLQLKQMSNIHDRDDIKARLDYRENQVSELDAAEAANQADKGNTYSQNYYIKAWHNSSEYKQLIAEDNELDIQNESIESELDMIDDMINSFEKGKENEIGTSCTLWGLGGG